MQLHAELLVGAGFAVAIVAALVIGLGRRKNRAIQRPAARGPANLRFTCAGCSEQFTHTKRTIGAWEKGTRRFYCNECHKKWRNSQPAQPTQGDLGSAAKHGSPAPSFHQPTQLRPAKAGAGGGCLGMLVLAIAVPIGVALVVAKYA